MDTQNIIKKVETLNEQIEGLNEKHRNAVVERNLLHKTLLENLKAYGEKYNITFSGSLEECANQIAAEKEKIESAIMQEIELSEKVITALNNGNYEEANTLLGIEVNSKEVAEVIKEASDAVAESTTEAVEEAGEDQDVEEFFTGSVEEEQEEAPAEVAEEPAVEEEAEDDFGDFFMDDSIEDLTSNNSEAPAEKPTEAKEEPAKKEASSSPLDGVNFSLDDDDEEEVDFGFGNLLSGSKFSVD